MVQNQNFSYNGILNILEAFATSHPDVYRFIAEDEDQMSEMTSKDEAFPVMFVAPIDNTYDFQMNEYRLRIYAYDRLMKDRSNVNDCRSRADKILNDLDVWLKEYSELPFEVDTVSTSYPFSSELMTDVTGWYIEVTIQSPSYSVCDIPFLDELIITGYTCDIQYTNKYLTCDGLAECSTFTDAIDNLQDQIDNLPVDTNTFTTGSTLSGTTILFDRNDGGTYSVDISPAIPAPFDCDDLSGCTIIQNIQNEFNNYLPLTGGTITGQLNVNIQNWTFDFMEALNITIYADDNYSIDEITNIVNVPTITIEVNDLPYTLGNPILLGDKIYIESDINSVIKIKIVK